MKWIKRIFTLVLILFVVVFLSYFLPSRDIVQIVGTDVKRMDIKDGDWFWDKPDAGTQAKETRDVRFINATRPNGKARVYRNEDTNWSFPPYFKFDSSDLNAAAQDLAKQDDIWVAVSHYGWRVKLFSAYPNAYKVKRVAGPKTLLIPWFNIVFLTILFLILLRIYRWLRRLKHKHVDPVADKIGDEISDAAQTISDHAETAQEHITKQGNAISRFFKGRFGASK